MTKIFISYSRHDKICVDSVAAAMRQQGYDIWIDDDIPRRKIWQEEIDDALAAMDVFMLFWSSHARASKNVQHEMRRAQQRAIHNEVEVVVVRLEAIDRPEMFDHIQEVEPLLYCNQQGIRQFVASLDDAWRTKPAQDQAEADLDATPHLQRTKLMERDGFLAHIVGPPGVTYTPAPARLAVCVQVTRSKKSSMLRDVAASIEHPNGWYLHITGPHGTDDTEFNLANSQFETCRAFVYDAITTAADEKTVLIFFVAGPAALFGGIAASFDKYWTREFYQFYRGKTPPYQKVLTL